VARIGDEFWVVKRAVIIDLWVKISVLGRRSAIEWLKGKTMVLI
jgi:hypothetical protein